MEEENNKRLVEPTPLEPKRRYELPRPHASNPHRYWEIIEKRGWMIVSVFLTVFTLVLAGTVNEKPVYKAEALLEIERGNPNIITVRELFQMENATDNYLETQYKILQSDTLARDVIRRLHLDQVREFNHGKPIRGGKTADALGPGGGTTLPTDAAHEQAVLRRFEERLSVSPIQRSSLVRVSFGSHDPNLAAEAVNTLVESYIQENFETHWEATQQASTWLTNQLAGLKIRLEKSEDAVQQYARRNGLLYLESSKGETENIVDERLRQLQDELTQAQADRYQKESLYRLVEAGDYGALPGVFGNKLTQDLTIRIADLERQQAALAPAFKPGYPKMKQLQSQIDRLKQLLARERAQATQHIADEYFAAVRREVLVNKAFDQQRMQANAVAEKSVQYNILKREADTNKQLYEGLLQRLKEARVSAGLKASNIRVVDAAVPPTSAVKPRVALNLALGALLGLAGGITLAFARERVDSTLKSPDDIETFLHMPALGMIPSRQPLAEGENGSGRALPMRVLAKIEHRRLEPTESEKQNGWVRVDAKSFEHSDLREAFRGLRTSVLLSTAGRAPRSVVFISAEAREGKTTICGNLAISLAQLGKRVLVVDADMRQPSIHDFFHVPDAPGLANYLAGDEEWRNLIRATGSKGLDCLTGGPEPPDPTELLSSERMQTLMREAMGDYNFVLVDSPPLLNVTDGRILTTVVDGAVFVIKGGATARELVQRAQVCVAEVGAHLIGAVLNDLDPRHADCYHARREAARVHNGNGRERTRV